MRPMYDPEVDVFRSQVQSFLAKNLPTDWQGIGVLPAVEAPCVGHGVAQDFAS